MCNLTILVFFTYQVFIYDIVFEVVLVDEGRLLDFIELILSGFHILLI